LPPEVKTQVTASFTWSIEEAEALIAAPTGEMWQRGDLGQGVYMLLASDPACDELLERVVRSTQDDDVRWHAALILVARAGSDGLTRLERLAEDTRPLAQHWLFGDLAVTLHEHGHVSLF
jgi:hypothetical protein